MRTSIIAVVTMSACARSKSTPPSALRNSCATLAIEIEVTRQFRDEASTQYVSANKAMTKWNQWDKKLISPAQDATGEYSGAASRARGFRDAGYALCQSASVVHAMLREVPVPDRDLRDAAGKATPLSCDLISISWTDFTRFNADWLALKQRAYDRENDILDVCRQKIPNWSPPSPNLPSITLPAE